MYTVTLHNGDASGIHFKYHIKDHKNINYIQYIIMT